MIRPTVIGGCFGGALGAFIYLLLWQTGGRISLLALPGAIPLLWRPVVQIPSVETLIFQIMAYSVVGALIGWPFGHYITTPIYRRRKRRELGLCVKCGYDLRGSKDRCPECGEEFGSTGVEG